jgi:hypothetical protein
VGGHPNWTLQRLLPDHASEKKYLVRYSRGGFAFP